MLLLLLLDIVQVAVVRPMTIAVIVIAIGVIAAIVQHATAVGDKGPDRAGENDVPVVTVVTAAGVAREGGLSGGLEEEARKKDKRPLLPEDDSDPSLLFLPRRVVVDG
ncbi:hypothetical protein FBU30_011231 [Linnemannia zychae]|nr:hypothetical protein FBU30_011231 [Linnemannia zychae]